MLAVGSGHTDSVIFILKSKADVNVVDKNRHPALFRAVSTYNV